MCVEIAYNAKISVVHFHIDRISMLQSEYIPTNMNLSLSEIDFCKNIKIFENLTFQTNAFSNWKVYNIASSWTIRFFLLFDVEPTSRIF